jgi:hypothetical protein
MKRGTRKLISGLRGLNKFNSSSKSPTGKPISRKHQAEMLKTLRSEKHYGKGAAKGARGWVKRKQYLGGQG